MSAIKKSALALVSFKSFLISSMFSCLVSVAIGSPVQPEPSSEPLARRSVERFFYEVKARDGLVVAIGELSMQEGQSSGTRVANWAQTAYLKDAYREDGLETLVYGVVDSGIELHVMPTRNANVFVMSLRSAELLSLDVFSSGDGMRVQVPRRRETSFSSIVELARGAEFSARSDNNAYVLWIKRAV